jgi:hypothetical protein
LEESTPDIPVLTIDITVAIVHINCSNIRELYILPTVSNDSQNKQRLSP